MSEPAGAWPRRVARSVGVLALLTLALPANLALTVVASVRPPVRPQPADDPRTVLLTGGKMTKALVLARAFHAAGHRVVLAESARYRLTGHRFSRAVDRFHTLPTPDDAGYAAAVARLVSREHVDVWVPISSPASSRPDALAAHELGPHVDVVHLDPDAIDVVDDKYRFARAAAELGLDVPDTHLITDPQQVRDVESRADGRPWILKSIAYDPVHRLDLTPLPRPTPAETEEFLRGREISEANPWILQEFVRGREYCTHGTARGGELQVYCCCASSAFQVNYAVVDHPGIEAWVRTFVRGLGLTGQVSFDFIETDDGRLVAIECNPRTHSAITLFAHHPELARGYLDDDVPTLTPPPGARPTYWTYHELWRLLRHPSTYRERWRVVTEGRDAIFSRSDPWPFLAVHHLQIPLLLVRDLLRGKGFIRVDFNIGKLVAPAGD